ncbi:AraC family transcriptional regulator [Actinophytocola sp.]|uniref:helix-turn-helix domain-containing protein n=1 Tax=Actinophytocola sp. TaxID=1872138 RepID=UPI0025BCE213|nr:AraC family transcriptional regulator [Actinophytocola sp.]
MSTAVPTLTYAERRPSEPVRTLLTRDYLGFAQPPGTSDRWLATPTPTATVIVNTGGAFGGYPRAFATGLTDTHDVIEQVGAIECVDLKLTPLGAYTLLGVPMDELTGRVVDLADVLGPAGHRLTERLANTAGWDARFAVLDEFLLRRAEEGPTPAREVAWAWRRLVESCGVLSIGELAHEVGWSRRHLVTRFRQQVGLPPKTVARIVRFDGLLRRVGTAGRAAWSRIATECGYYDQAHMNRDFREFAGTTPTAFLARLPERMAERMAAEVTSVQYTWVPAG